MIVFIIGPRSFGKTKTGGLLAESLGYEFIDADQPFLKEIRERFGSVMKFFNRKENEKQDNLYEWHSLIQVHLKRILDGLSKEKDYVIVLGGSYLAETEPVKKVQQLLDKNLELINKAINEFGGVKVLVQWSKSVDTCIKIAWEREKDRWPGATYDKCAKDIKYRIDKYREIADLIITGEKSKNNAKKLIEQLKIIKQGLRFA
jgi:shikimate kinase